MGRITGKLFLGLFLVVIEQGLAVAAFMQDSGADGIVSINASSFANRIAQGGYSWDDVTPSGHEGTAALQALPNSGTNHNTGFETLSPRADYQVEFNRTGLHYVWIRGSGASGNDDSLHVGLDGAAQSDSDRITGFGASLDWSNATMDVIVASIDVPSTGLHTINVWMREDGMVYDKFLLTSNAGFVPTGTGPTESPQGPPTLSAPTISPNGGTFTGSVTVTLANSEPTATIFYTTDGSDPVISGTTYGAPFDLTADATVRTYATAPGFLDSAESSAVFIISAALAFQQDSGADGIVSINASSFATRIAQGGHSWDDVTPSGHEGTAALQALPNNGTNHNTGFETLSPRADYQVEFNRTGLHYFWIRGSGASGNDDSLHVGLDGAPQPDSDRITGFGTSLDWSNETMDVNVTSIDVPFTGLHTINVWMREDGTVYDKFLLTSNAAFVPTGTGPAQSPPVGTSTLAAPTISPNGGTFAGSVTVTLANSEPTATIFYTTDGSDPVTSGTTYSAPFDLTADATVRTYATAPGFDDSAEASAAFVITTQLTVPTISPNGGTFAGSVTVTLANSEPTATIFYTTDGSDPVTSGTTYSAPFDLTADATVRTYATAPGFDDSAEASAAFVITTQLTVPTISPNGGTFAGSVTVTLANSEPTATIFYTADGSDPAVSGTTYSSPFDLIADATVRTYATAPGFTDSAEASAAFVITTQLTAPTISPNGGTFAGSVTVTLDNSEPTATIFYTADGSDPAVSGTTYSAPFDLIADATVRTYATAPGFTDSAEASAAFVITTQLTAPTISPNGGTFAGSVTVTLDNSEPTATIFYTADGSDPAVSGTTYSAPFDLIADATVRTYATAPGFTDSAEASAAFVITAGTGAFLQDAGADGIVSINASSFATRIAQGGHSWEDVTTSGHEGTAALQALPNNGTNVNTGFETLSPRADYQVEFNRTGLHYVWIRGSGASGNDDSLHVGLDAAAQLESDRISGFGPSLDWSNETMDVNVASIDVPFKGLHTINVWMREDGTVYDKFMLTSNAGYVPTGTGPPQSPQSGTLTLAAPTISPNGGTFAGSVAVTLGSNEPAATIFYTTDGSDPVISGTVLTYSAPIDLTADAIVRTYATAPGFVDSAESSAAFTISDALAFQQDAGADGIVSINASSLANRIAQSGHSWDDVTPASHEGTAALQALPNIGTNINTGFQTLSPRADYQVEFNRTGLHFVWIRGSGAGSGQDDSLHVGLDGVAQPHSDRITGFGASLDWSNETMDVIVASIDVPSTGLHTINVWMREDGTIFDKLLLTSNVAFVPTGTGPAQSPQVIPMLSAPTISPNGGFFGGSVAVTLVSIDSGATIHYTTDGTDPRSSGTAVTYSGTFFVNATASVRAAARMSEFLDSEITARDFTETSCTISRIMPLGDSITEGVFGPVAAGPGIVLRGGYRGLLYRSLVDNGYTVDFAGGLLAGGSLMPQIDPEHEGHSGWNDNQVAANVYSFLQNNPADIVLLHVGTNGFETSAADVGTILDEIDRFETDSGTPITVILAKIINRKTFHSPTSTFNANLEALALARISAGDSIVLIDQENALNYPGDMFDNLHPNSTGYAKMSNVWFTALQALISPCGT